MKFELGSLILLFAGTDAVDVRPIPPNAASTVADDGDASRLLARTGPAVRSLGSVGDKETDSSQGQGGLRHSHFPPPRRTIHNSIHGRQVDILRAHEGAGVSNRERKLFFSSFFSSVVSGIESGFSEVKSIASEIEDGVGDVVSEIEDGVGDVVSGIESGLSEVEDVLSEVEDIFGDVGAGFEDVWRGVDNGFGEGVDWLEDGIDVTGDAFGDAAGFIEDVARPAFEEIENVSRDLVERAADGVIWIAKKAESFLECVANGYEDQLTCAGGFLNQMATCADPFQNMCSFGFLDACAISVGLTFPSLEWEGEIKSTRTYGTASLRASAEAAFEIEGKAEAEVRYDKRGTLGVGPALEKMYMKTDTKMIVSTTLKLEATGNADYSDEISLGIPRNLFRKLVVVGQVPLLLEIDVEPMLYLDASIEATGDIEMVIQAELKSVLEVDFLNLGGILTRSPLDHDQGIQVESFTLNGSFDANVKARISARFSFSVNKLPVTVDVAAATSTSLDLSAEGNIFGEKCLTGSHDGFDLGIETRVAFGESLDLGADLGIVEKFSMACGSFMAVLDTGLQLVGPIADCFADEIGVDIPNADERSSFLQNSCNVMAAEVKQFGIATQFSDMFDEVLGDWTEEDWKEVLVLERGRSMQTGACDDVNSSAAAGESSTGDNSRPAPSLGGGGSRDDECGSMSKWVCKDKPGCKWKKGTCKSRDGSTSSDGSGPGSCADVDMRECKDRSDCHWKKDLSICLESKSRDGSTSSDGSGPGSCADVDMRECKDRSDCHWKKGWSICLEKNEPPGEPGSAGHAARSPLFFTSTMTANLPPVNSEDPPPNSTGTMSTNLPQRNSEEEISGYAEYSSAIYGRDARSMLGAAVSLLIFAWWI